MKYFLLISSLIFILSSSLLGQARDRSIWTGGTTYDTCAVSDDSVSATVTWNSWETMRGGLKLWGWLYHISGDDTTIFTVNFRMLNNPGETGYKHNLGTVTVIADSAKWEFNVATESWWNVCQGYNVTFVPDSTTSSTGIKARELAK
jgi:hypothetical protein